MTDHTTRPAANPGQHADKRKRIPILVWIVLAAVAAWIAAFTIRAMTTQEAQPVATQPVEPGEPGPAVPMKSDAARRP